MKKLFIAVLALTLFGALLLSANGVKLVADGFHPDLVPIERLKALGIEAVRVAPELYLKAETAIKIDDLRKAGISVSLTDSESEHFAVIDKKLVWHGGMNLLGKEDAWDNLIRVESVKAAAELLEMTKKQTE